MFQVILNIITNSEQACVAAHQGGALTIEGSVIGENVRVSISDDGPGIPPDELSKIFEPFFTTKDVGLGTGLGLSVSHGIISQHDGRIWAESTLGNGATFHMELPISTEAEKIRQGNVEASAQSRSIRRSNILVVDDERDLRTILAERLSGMGYSVDLAGSGEEAWSRINDLEYHCILIDMRMPGISGQELYTRIADSDEELAARVLFMTGVPSIQRRSSSLIWCLTRS